MGNPPPEDDYSVPIFTGEPSTDLPDGYYKGNLSRKSYNIYKLDYPFMTKEDFEAAHLTVDTLFELNINNNKLKWEGYIENAEGKEALKSGLEYGATIESKENGEYGSVKETETIKFTISNDNDNISITYIFGTSVDVSEVEYEETGEKISYKFSYDVTYEGTLTKSENPTPTPPLSES